MRQKPYNLDPHTFGGSRASENLAKILMENPRLIRKVSSTYHKFTHNLGRLLVTAKYFRGDGFIQEIMSMYRKKIFDKVKNSNYPTLIESHLLNVMNASYAETLVKVKDIIK